MKRLIFLGSLSLITFFAKSQSLGINNTGAAGDASSILDLSSTSKGLLIPRMNLTQRNAISSPATGLMIYQTDNTPGFYFYDGSSWKRTATSDNASYAAGTGISISSNTITNTAPDQTVTLTNGTGITVTGTYPNFTITNSSPSSGGTVTSVGLTTGTTGTDVNISNSPITSSGSITLNIPTASATNRGALSSTDWSTFNGKENALTFSAPLSRTSNTISLGTVGVANGGTGQTTYTDGQLLIGNTTGNTLTKATLTAGTGIAITNGNGSISIATTGAAPTGSAGGDLSGTYPNPIVSKINGVALGTTTATSGNLLIANGTTWGTTAMSGDATINSAGALTIGNGAVTSAKIADGTIAAGDLSSMSATSGQVLKYNGSAWAPAADNNAGGTVTSVGLSLPSIFSVTNSPITTSGTLTGSLANQSANTVFAGPTTGVAAAPVFRALVASDIPTLNQNTTGSAGSVANALTFNNGGSGAASGTTFNGSSAQTISYNTIGAVGGSGTSTQVAYFNASNTLTSSSAVTIQPNTATTTSGSLAVTSNSTTANTQAIYGSATGAALVYGILGTTSSATWNAAGVKGTATGGATGVWGTASSNGAYGVYGENTSTGTGSQYGVVGVKTGATGTGTGYGVFGQATGSGTNNFGGYFTSSGATNNYGVYGLQNGSVDWGVTGINNAANGTSSGNGVYGRTNQTLGAGVFGRNSYSGTTPAGAAGVYGVVSANTNASGSGYHAWSTSAGVQGYIPYSTSTTNADRYQFGVAGTKSAGNITPTYYDRRSGGVLGSLTNANDLTGVVWGCLGYLTSGGSQNAVQGNGVYVNSTGYSNNNIVAGVGGAFFGGVIGGWTRGLVMGQISSGEMFASYNQGDEYTSGRQIELVNTADSKVPAYSLTSTSVKIYDDGTGKLQNGYATIQFEESFKVLLGAKPTITVTPIGESNGIHIVSIDQNGFTIKENQNGSSNIEFNWIAAGKRIDAISEIPKDILDKNFDENMRGVMFNESDTKHSAKPIWWDGSKISFDEIPSLPDTNRNTGKKHLKEEMMDREIISPIELKSSNRNN